MIEFDEVEKEKIGSLVVKHKRSEMRSLSQGNLSCPRRHRMGYIGCIRAYAFKYSTHRFLYVYVTVLIIIIRFVVKLCYFDKKNSKLKYNLN